MNPCGPLSNSKRTATTFVRLHRHTYFGRPAVGLLETGRELHEFSSVGRVSDQHGVLLARTRVVVAGKGADFGEVARLLELQRQPIAGGVAAEGFAVVLSRVAAGAVVGCAVEQRAGVLAAAGVAAMIFGMRQKLVDQIVLHDVRIGGGVGHRCWRALDFAFGNGKSMSTTATGTRLYADSKLC